jgi:hypothetical protein
LRRWYGGRTAMSKTITILLGIAVLWFTAWAIAGYYMRDAGIEKVALSEHLSTPATELAPGADVRAEGTVLGETRARAPYSGEPCLAAVTHVSIGSSYTDSRGKHVSVWNHVATRRAGPPSVELAVADARVELPIELWRPKAFVEEAMDAIPPQLGVASADIAVAKQRAQGTLGRYNVSEATLSAGTRFFVAGRLEDDAGALRLAPDRLLGHVELYPGSQEEFVRELGRSGGGLQTAGWILGAGLGPLPLLIIGVVVLVRRSKPAAA